MKTKKGILMSLTMLCFLTAAIQFPVYGDQDLTARQIMQKADEDNKTDDSNYLLTMEIRRGDSKRVRKMKMWMKSDDQGNDRSLIRFTHPADVKGTGFLTIEHSDRDDDQWLYLPALKKVRRIASSKKGGSFMGSDLSYADMSAEDIDDYSYKLISSEVINGNDCYVIEEIPATEEIKKDEGYGNDDMPGSTLQYGDTDNYFGVNLKELYIDMAIGIFDFRLGSQVVSWGKVDAFAPTDNINPMDYRGFDILDFSNMKIAIPMLKADAYLFDYYLHIEGIYIPYFFESVYPGQDSDWAFYQPPTPDTMVIDGATYNVDSVVQNSTVYPSKRLAHSEAGVRAASSIAGYDFSGSYFYTWDDNPTVHQEFALNSPGPGDVTVTVTPRYHRLHIIGLDLAKAIGELSLRMESAFFITEDTEGEDSDIADPYLRWAIGADYAFFTDYSINLQFSGEITGIRLNFNTLNHAETLNTIILGLTGNFLEERLYAEIGAIYELEDEDYLIVPKVEYDFSDSLSLSAGAHIFGGNAGTQFGSFDENDAHFVNAKYSF